MLHEEPIARSVKNEESGASASVGKAWPSESENIRKAVSRYIVADFFAFSEG